MSFPVVKLIVWFSLWLPLWAATHDELPQCGLTGVYKTRQSVLETPNYPSNYPPNTCWDYIVRSPYRCPTKFHVQFLDFQLESSENCTHDYLAIGLEGDGDDIDVLCGQVIGIKKYHTPDGILRLRFYADDSPWSTGKGFKLLVTRLACERKDFLADNLAATAEHTAYPTPLLHLVPPLVARPTAFRNFSVQEQHQIYRLPPVFGAQTQSRLPAPPAPPTGSFYQPPAQVPPTATDDKPCQPGATQQPAPAQFYIPTESYQSHQELPLLTDQYPATPWRAPQPTYKPNDVPQSTQFPVHFGAALSTQPCCANSFRQQHFYLSSPGFPRTAFTSLLPTQQRDCQFQIEKSSTSVCRLHVAFQFFDFGQAYAGTGAPTGNIGEAIGSSKDVCTEDFVEIDGQRFCGCRTGYTHSVYWGANAKVIRMRMGYSGLPSLGFLMDILQEECVPIEQNVNKALFAYQNFANTQQQNYRPFIPLSGSGFGATPTQNAYVPQIQTLPRQYPTVPTQTQTLQPLAYQPQPYYQQLNPLFYHTYRYNTHLGSPQIWSPAPQFRRTRQIAYARAEDQPPHTVVETNSTRKEFYYFDGDEAFRNARLQEEPDDLQRLFSIDRQRCSFDTADALRLAGDVLWITKPICHVPQRSLFKRAMV